MKSIKIEKFGAPEVLKIQDIEVGKPGPKEVLIKNNSIGLNFIYKFISPLFFIIFLLKNFSQLVIFKYFN